MSKRAPPAVLQCEVSGCGKVRIVRQTDVRWYDKNRPPPHRFECPELWHCKCADPADDGDPKSKSKWIGRGGRALIDGPEGHIPPDKNPYFGENPPPAGPPRRGRAAVEQEPSAKRRKVGFAGTHGLPSGRGGQQQQEHHEQGGPRAPRRGGGLYASTGGPGKAGRARGGRSRSPASRMTWRDLDPTTILLKYADPAVLHGTQHTKNAAGTFISQNGKKTRKTTLPGPLHIAQQALQYKYSQRDMLDRQISLARRSTMGSSLLGREVWDYSEVCGGPDKHVIYSVGTEPVGQYPHAHNCRHKGGSLDSQGTEPVEDRVHV